MADSLTIRNKEYVKSTEVEQLAADVIAEKTLDVSPARIKYLLIYPHINKTTAGRCNKATNLLKFYGEVDYVIELSGEFYDQLDKDRRKILLWHELLHVHPIINEKTGEWEFKIRKHDIGDFATIINEYGVKWISEFKTIFSSVYDLDNLNELSL